MYMGIFAWSLPVRTMRTMHRQAQKMRSMGSQMMLGGLAPKQRILSNETPVPAWTMWFAAWHQDTGPTWISASASYSCVLAVMWLGQDLSKWALRGARSSAHDTSL